MKIGILTFHAQINYGGVLQCVALQTALKRMGHEVVVIDRWFDAKNTTLMGCYREYTLFDWLRFVFRFILGGGDWRYMARRWKTAKYIKKALNLTPYHFVEWKDAPENLGVDLLVVGSDQVWHCGDWGRPEVYLLLQAPKVRAIAYSASFGLKELPEYLSDRTKAAKALPFYREGLAKFDAISCREKEGVEICRRLGFEAEHVVDPTLLAWLEDGDKNREGRTDLVCYFMEDYLDEVYDKLERFAQENDCKVKVFLNFPHTKRLPKRPNVVIAADASPEEFVNAFKKARWVVSDSFHALMFSACFNCDARILKPECEARRRMFGRIEEIAERVTGNLIVDSVADALASFSRKEEIAYDYAWLAARLDESQKWLAKAISNG